MKAMVLKECCEIGIQGEPRRRIDLPLKEEPLEMAELPDPTPDSKQINWGRSGLVPLGIPHRKDLTVPLILRRLENRFGRP